MDGGESWTLTTDLIEDAVVTVDARDSDQIHAVGADGTLVFSNDAGKLWKIVEAGDAKD